MFSKPTLLCIFILMWVFPLANYAACSKEDIEFYLDKGFTQDQITQLCSASSTNVPDYQPYQQKIIIYSNEEAPGKKNGFTKEERQAIKALREGGDVINLKVDAKSIKYTRVVCITAGNNPERDQRARECPNVYFSVSRDGLKAASSGKKLIVLGKSYVTLEGDIFRKLKGNWDDYSIAVRKELERNFNWKEDGHKSNFPVRGDYSVTKIVDAIRTLSTADIEEYDTLVENEEQVEEPVLEVRAEDTKKKKKWWNPFD